MVKIIMPQLKIYVEQGDIFWRFTPENLRSLLTKAISTGHYDLNKFGKQLKGTPKSIRKYTRNKGNIDYTTHFGSNAFLFRMVDTDEDDWREIRDTIILLDRRNKEKVSKRKNKQKTLRRENRW